MTFRQCIVSRLQTVKYVKQLSKKGGSGVVATCNRYLLKSPTLGGEKTTAWNSIEVLREEAEDFIENEEIRLRMLVYHELFHCLMDRGHLPADMPPGIMSETLSKGNARIYEERWETMVDALFANAASCPELRLD